MLDTNACIKIMNGDEAVRRKFAEAHPQGILISAVVLSELAFGVQNSARVERNDAILRAFLTTVGVVPFDTNAAIAYGHVRADLKKQRATIGPYDVQIAAHAVSLGLPIVTHNKSEFQRVNGLTVFDWQDE